jgi:hypothetical protein
MSSADLCLNALLADESLGLELLTGDDGLTRRIEGAHAIELVDAGRYVERNWLVLTTGLAFAQSVSHQEMFVDGLAEAGVSAIGFGIDVSVPAVPAGLLRAANDAGMPVFSVPARTTFSTIVKRVLTEVLHGAAPQMARLLTMQERLAAVLDERDPEDAVLSVLADLLGASGGIVVGGSVVAHVGNAPWPRLLEQVGAGHGYRSDESGVGICVAVGVGTEHSDVLALSVPRGPAQAYARPIARFAAVVLQMAATGRRVAAEQERAVRSALLSDLLDAPRLSTELIERVKGFGFDPAQPVRCVVLRGAQEEGLGRAVVTAVDRFFADRRICRLVRLHADDVLAMWQGPYTGAGLLDAVAALPGSERLVGGVGPVTCLREGEVFASAVAGARGAALQATDGTGGARLTSYEELAYCDLVLSLVPPNHHSAAPSPLELLRQDKTDLLSTLCAYFDHDLDVVACARTLNLHPNSLRYRLTRVEQRLGRSLRSPATITDLYLALRAERMHGEPPERAVTAVARQAARSRTPLA